MLKITVHDRRGKERFIYTDREFYDILVNYVFCINNGSISGYGVNDSNNVVPIFNLIGFTKHNYWEFVDGDISNYTKDNIIGLQKQRNASSKYLGVVKLKNGSYRAVLHKDGRDIHVGGSTSEEYCAKLYDVAARRVRGESAMLNFPDYENPNIKLPGDDGYVRLPILNTRRKSDYFGVSIGNKCFRACISGIELGTYPTEQLAALAIAYASVVTGLYKVDLRFLNFSKKEYKRLTTDYSLLTKKERLKIRKLLKGIKWM